MKLIDKETLIAEIERLAEVGRTNANVFNKHRKEKAIWLQQAGVCNRILSFINTLEVKEVDLEKEIKNRIDSLSNLYCYMEDLFINGNEEEGVYPIPEKVTNELFEFAKHFFELGLKTKGE